ERRNQAPADSRRLRGAGIAPHGAQSRLLRHHGAPSAGPPPYEVYEVIPVTVFGLGTDKPYGATRWRF
ncbi:MAG TPA: hypothetical protein VJQ26_06560, partial [Ktedonobacteraceae bacterium]|nr:hypothetical protein [Ktedonobacteraceae bacterium]